MNEKRKKERNSSTKRMTIRDKGAHRKESTNGICSFPIRSIVANSPFRLTDDSEDKETSQRKCGK